MEAAHNTAEVLEWEDFTGVSGRIIGSSAFNGTHLE